MLDTGYLEKKKNLVTHMETISKELSLLIKRTDLLLKLFWGGNFISYGLFVFISFNAISMNKEAPQDNLNLILLFSFLGILACTASFAFRHFMLSPVAIIRYLNGKYPKFLLGSRKFPIPKANAEIAKTLSAEEQLLFEFSTNCFNTFCLSFGLLNACAVFGLMLAMMTRTPYFSVFFSVFAALLLLCQFPSLKRLFEAALVEKSFRQY